MKFIGLKRNLIIFGGVLWLILGTAGCSGHERGSGRHGARQGGPPSKEALFNEYDADSDGKLSKEEFPGPDDHFKELDQNSDGYLEKDEVPDSPPSRSRRG